MMSEMEMLYLICKHVVYFLFRKAGGGGGVSMSPYRNKTNPVYGVFFLHTPWWSEMLKKAWLRDDDRIQWPWSSKIAMSGR
jgi:hypothetical protein